MGLLRKRNPAEKKLKELTGGFTLNSSFVELLKSHGLSSVDGLEIKKQLKEEVNQNLVKAEDVESRLNFLIEKKKEEKKSNNSSSKRTLEDSKVKSTNNNDTITIREVSLSETVDDNKVKELKFLLNQEHNLVKCPECNKEILKKDKYCYSCGFELSKIANSDSKIESKSDFKFGVEIDVKSSTGLDMEYKPNVELKNVKNKSVGDELSQLEQQYNETKAVNDELNELENLYNKKVSTKYSPKFKFAIALYLKEINKNPNKSINGDYYQYNYDTTLAKIKKQVKEDEFIGEGSPLMAAKGATVKDLKKLLKKHDLMVSGTKAELIERLGENLSEDELKQAFPKKVFSVTEKGLEFIEENRYVFYYDKSTPIKTHLEVEEYDSIFEGVDDLSDENIHQLLIEFLEKREDDFANKKNWAGYRYNFMALAKVYKDSGDNLKVLDNDFKLFIAGINNFNDYTNQSEPAYGYIGKTYSNELIELLHSLSLDIDELKTRFNGSYDDLKYPDLKISKEESLVYLLKLFSGEDVQDLTDEIHSKYPFSNAYY